MTMTATSRAPPSAYSSIDRFWDDARVKRLCELFDRGLSNNQIAVEMNIRSRNAVIGKLHRLGLAREKTKAAQQHRGARMQLVRMEEEKAPKPAASAPPLSRRRKPPQPAVLAPDAGPPLEADGITDLQIETNASRVSLLACTKGQCRWPAADDGSANMVCGETAVAGSYCARHGQRAVQPWRPARKAART